MAEPKPDKRTRRLVIIGVVMFVIPILIGWAMLAYFIQTREKPLPYQLPSRHPVGKAESQSAAELASRPAPPFELMGTDDRKHSVASLTRRGPLLLYFINKVCPCSIEAEPMFIRLDLAYKGSAAVVGLLHGSLQDAKDWANANDTTHLVLADPTGEVVKAYGVPRSVYTALIDKSGQITHMWPGYSGTMLLEATEELAQLAGVPRKRIDPGYAPTRLTTGCEFEFEPEPSAKSK